MRTLLVVTSVLLGAAAATAERVPTGPITVRGTLLDANNLNAHCGDMEIWTILKFDVSADPKAPRGTHVDAKHLPVAVPCVELTRPQYSKTAGNAGVLTKGKSYVLTLDAPAVGAWGNQHAWAARKIDNVK